MEEGLTIEQIIWRAIEDGLSLEIDYINNSYQKSSRVISDIKISQKYGFGYISAYCHLREQERDFKMSKIMDARIVSSSSKRKGKQLFNYEFDPSKPIFPLYGEEY